MIFVSEWKYRQFKMLPVCIYHYDHRASKADMCHTHTHHVNQAVQKTFIRPHKNIFEVLKICWVRFWQTWYAKRQAVGISCLHHYKEMWLCIWQLWKMVWVVTIISAGRSFENQNLVGFLGSGYLSGSGRLHTKQLVWTSFLLNSVQTILYPTTNTESTSVQAKIHTQLMPNQEFET